MRFADAIGSHLFEVGKLRLRDIRMGCLHVDLLSCTQSVSFMPLGPSGLLPPHDSRLALASEHGQGDSRSTACSASRLGNVDQVYRFGKETCSFPSNLVSQRTRCIRKPVCPIGVTSLGCWGLGLARPK